MCLKYIAQHLAIFFFLKRNMPPILAFFTLAARELRVKLKAVEQDLLWALFLPSHQAEYVLLILMFLGPRSLLL